MMQQEAAGWDELATIRRDRTIGPALKIAYEVLWAWAGGPERIRVHVARLAYECGRDPRSARDWLEGLSRWPSFRLKLSCPLC